ncbi:Transposase, IS4 (plasmid) [Deinococcus gobiensis I-0]|uniref:Transposase, IS4 n=1 Tax=Deinococcus gobiensis (strain DSM 21396 / JCM 16679 / CGMCC 1.7299 / I-0) TaxID=745776 RepID=H8H1S9_DEIGI|nr:Transposase, IS4 [Deinococcus gobiensis I-0]
MPVWAVFKNLQVGEVRVWHRQTRIYGVNLRVAATKNAAGDMLYLAYRGHALPNMRRYALRWQTENLHAALKTRGFNLEDTGLTRPERVSSLLTVISVAFIWACVTGEVVAR